MHFIVEQTISKSNSSLYEQSFRTREMPWVLPNDYHITLTSKRESNSDYKVALVEPRSLTRLSLSQLLEKGNVVSCSLNNFTVLSFPNCNELLACTSNYHNNLKLIIFNIGTVAIIDEQLYGEMSRIRAELSQVPLTVLCDSDEPSLILDAIRLGAQGFITTSLDLPLIMKALHLIAAGGMFIPNSILLQILKNLYEK